MDFSGHPYFFSSCHSPVLPTVSSALLKSIKYHIQFPVLFNAPFLSQSETKYHIHSDPVTSEATMCLRNYPCYVGRQFVEEDPGEDRVCYGKKRDSSIVPTVCCALSSANSSSLISIQVVLVFALKCARLNRSALCLDCM